MANSPGKLVLILIIIIISALSTAGVTAVGRHIFIKNLSQVPNEIPGEKFPDNQYDPLKKNDPLVAQELEEMRKPLLSVDMWDNVEETTLNYNSPQKTLSETPPKAATPIQITYPLKARRKGWEGETLLEVAISPSGIIESVKVISESGYPILDEAAIRAIKATSFIPGSSKSTMKISCSVKFELE